jgi:hypothetical protein
VPPSGQRTPPHAVCRMELDGLSPLKSLNLFDRFEALDEEIEG